MDLGVHGAEGDLGLWWGLWWGRGGRGGRLDGGVPPLPHLKGAKKLVREKMGQAPRPKKSTDVIRSKQRPRATYLPLIFNKLGIEDLMEFPI